MRPAQWPCLSKCFHFILLVETFVLQSVFGYAVLGFFKHDANPAEDMKNSELISVSSEPCLYAAGEFLLVSVTVVE